MKEKLQNIRLQDLLRHRNYLTITCAGLLLSNVILSFVCLNKDERITLIPPELKGPVWVERGQVSSQYLEEMTLFFASILLNKTPQSINYSHELLLKYADSRGIGALKHQFLQEEERYKKSGLSTSFYPKKVTIYESKMQADIRGEMMGFVGQKCIFQQEEVYRFTFSYSHGRLLIKSFELITGKEDGHA